MLNFLKFEVNSIERNHVSRTEMWQNFALLMTIHFLLFVAGCKYRREYKFRGAAPAGQDSFLFRWQLLVQYYILLDIFLYNVKITEHTESWSILTQQKVKAERMIGFLQFWLKDFAQHSLLVLVERPPVRPKVKLSYIGALKAEQNYFDQNFSHCRTKNI